MNLIDIIIVVLVLVGFWRGLVMGAVKTAMSFVVWLLALVAGTALAKPLSIFFVGVADGRIAQIALAFVAVVAVVIMLGHLIAFILTKTLNFLHLGLIDKLLGGVLGAGRSLLKVLIVLSVISPLVVNVASFRSSVVVQTLLPFAPIAKTLALKAVNQLKETVDNPLSP